MAKNICHTTLIGPRWFAEEVLRLVEGRDFESVGVFRVDAGSGEVFLERGREDACYVARSVFEGTCPVVLARLKARRKMAQKEQAAARERGDPALEGVWRLRQLVLKVLMNSLFGVNGTNMFEEEVVVGEHRVLRKSMTVGESITRFGQWSNHVAQYAAKKEMGLETVYGDTDSIFTTMRARSVSEVVGRCRELENKFGDYFPSPMRLEFEKVFTELLLLKKKRYVGRLGAPTQEMKAMGVAAARRDSNRLVARVVMEVLDWLFVKKSLANACLVCVRAVQALSRGDVSWYELVQSRSLSKPPDKYVSKLPHVALAERLSARRPDLIQPPMRLEYVVCDGGKRARVSDLAELPEEALARGASLRTEYYLENLLTPLQQLLRPILQDQTDRVLRAGVTSCGGLVRVRKASTLPPAFALAGFTAQSRCRLCGTILPDGELQKLCPRCAPSSWEGSLAKIRDIEDLAGEQYHAWCQCHSCLGGGPVGPTFSCWATNCEFFWKREQHGRRLQEEAGHGLGLLQDLDSLYEPTQNGGGTGS